MSKIDWLILTAANRAQAQGYVAQLEHRARLGLLPAGIRWRVVADPGGRRVGSGGSTLWVLYELARTLRKEQPPTRSLRELFQRRRILVIHSGGDSRRLCCYAAQGKIFTPLPCNGPGGQPATLFDLMLADLAQLPAPDMGQVLIAAGDVLLTFHHGDANFQQAGVVGVAYPGPAERGAKHGVYVADRNGRVRDFLQKPDLATAEKRQALDAVGRMLIDTGLVSLDPATVQQWLEAAGVKLRQGKLVLQAGLLRDVAAGRALAVDLYEQILMALPPALNLEQYLQQVAPPAGRSAVEERQRVHLTHLHRALHGQPFAVNVLPYCDFFHIGSSRELLANIGSLSRTAREYGFQNGARAVVGDRAALEGAFVYNSVLRAGAVRIGAGVLLEAVDARGAVQLPGRNIVVGWPAQAGVPLQLPEGWGVVCLPVRGGKWAAVVFGIADDFKTPRAWNGTFGNRPLDQFLTECNLRPQEIWSQRDPARQTLWDARLWCVGTINQALRGILWMCAARLQPAPPHWRRQRRVTMAQLLTRVDHRRLIAHRQEVQRRWEIHSLRRRLETDPFLPAKTIVAALTDAAEARVALQQINQAVKQDARPLSQARWCWLAREIGTRFPAAGKNSPVPSVRDWEQAAFAAVARVVAQEIKTSAGPRPAAVLPDQVVWVTTPVRLDFAGGWSDTPPIGAELGGAVLNAAITLNGQYPIQVIAKLAEEKRIVLNSMDLGQRLTLTNTVDLLDYQNPSHWAALPKAALVLAGVCPAQRSQKLERWLEALGGGLDITLFSAVPKGSGLGTSSILGAALLACLARVVGEKLTNDTLIARTSLLEQMMTTAGGWQDQVGGITPGVKLIRTQPGPEQTPSLHWTGFAPSGEVRERLLLYYTGQKRLARNILQRVVGRYLARDPQAIVIIDRLKKSAEQMKHDLDRGDLNAFAGGIEEYWTLKKQLDPGSTNAGIEAILRPIQRYLSGKVLSGAGGGGFVFMVARDPQAAQRIAKVLTKSPPSPLARFFDFAFDPKGLAVTVL